MQFLFVQAKKSIYVFKNFFSPLSQKNIYFFKNFFSACMRVDPNSTCLNAGHRFLTRDRPVYAQVGFNGSNSSWPESCLQVGLCFATPRRSQCTFLGLSLKMKIYIIFSKGERILYLKRDSLKLFQKCGTLLWDPHDDDPNGSS